MASQRSKKSYVWNYFKISDKEDKAVCQLCNAVISRGGVGKTATASAMINHLKNKHYNEFLEYSRETATQQKRKADALDLEEHQSSLVKQRKIKKQLTLAETVEITKKFNINEENAVKIHEAIAEMLVIDNFPLNTVNGRGFSKLMATVCPKYQIPSRTYFTQTILPKMYEKCKLNVEKALLQEADINIKVSFTTDIWTCSHNNEPFLSWTAHWINKNFEYVHAVLNVTHFPGHHTGEKIAEMLRRLLETWKLQENNVHLVVSDNAANMLKGLRDGNLGHVGCFIHSLQIIINGALSSQRSVSDMVSVGKKIVGHFKHSSLACYKLRQIQEELKIPVKQLVQDTPTRWNSTYYLLKRLDEQKRAVSVYCTENNFNNFTSNQWSLLEATLRILTPFEEITRKLSANRSMISDVIPLIRILERFLNKDSEMFFGIGTLKAELIKQMQEKFVNIEKNNYYLIATVLDPRYKISFFNNAKVSNEELMSLLLNLIKSEVSLKENTPENTSPSPPSENIASTNKNTSTENETQNPSSDKETFSVWDCFNEFVATGGGNTPQKVVDVDSRIKKELNMYLNETVIDKDLDPITWWKNNKMIYPCLSALAAVYLCAPGTSVYSERAFSEAGNIYTDTRSRLLPENAEMILFLHHNLHNFK